MKIASFNIQNLYYRHRDFIQKSRSQNVQQWLQEMDALLRKPRKDITDKSRIQDLSFLLGFESSEIQPYAVLGRRAGELYFKKEKGQSLSKASFLTKWEGWVHVRNVPIHEKAIQHKARMIADCDADILVIQEVEDRASLLEFNKEFLPILKRTPYEEILVLETNDSRGMGMGIMLKNGYRLQDIKSHAYDKGDGGVVLFEQDCQEYSITTPSGETMVIILVQFSTMATQRREQAIYVAKMYENLQKQKIQQILICGTLNDVSYSEALSPLLRDTNLTQATRLNNFRVEAEEGKAGSYHRLGGYAKGINIKQKDYVLLSPLLNQRAQSAGLHRKGTWTDHAPKWPLYAGLTHKDYAASEHPLLWVDII